MPGKRHRDLTCVYRVEGNIPVPHVLIAFVVMHVLFGFTLSLVFQLAPTVEHSAFPIPEAHTGRIPHEWAVREVQTTANFALTNAFARWYLGGVELPD